jgi:hypothetical protein
MTDLLEDIDVTVWEQQFEEVQCESVMHNEKGYPTHPANWYATGPCGDVIAVCETRRQQCFGHGGWKCVIGRNGGCSAFHPYDHIQFHPVKG